MSQEITDGSTYGSLSPKGHLRLMDDFDSQRQDDNENVHVNPENSVEQRCPRLSAPILVTSTNNKSLKERRDAYGTLIHHTAKKHRIKFKSDISEVNEVENWKEYNVGQAPCCQCNLM